MTSAKPRPPSGDSESAMAAPPTSRGDESGAVVPAEGGDQDREWGETGTAAARAASR